jgi:hypothetical protein
MSAQVIDGMAKAGRTSLTAEDSYKQGKLFSSWIVDDFICCNVGDTNVNVIEIALGNNPKFPVRNVYKITLKGN